MANVDLIAKAWGTIWLESYHQSNPWRELTRDVSSFFPEGVDSYDFPIDPTAYATAELDRAQQLGTTASELARPVPTVVSGNTVNMVMRTLPSQDYLIGIVASRNVRPDLLETAARHSARVMVETISEAIRAIFDGLTSRNVGAAISTAAANFGDAAHMKAIFDTLREAAKKADVEHWPRADRYCVVSPAYFDLITAYLLELKLLLVGGTTDRVLLSRELQILSGWDIVMDDSMEPSEAASTDNHKMYFGRRSEGLYHAVREVERAVFDPSERYRGIVMAETMQYGAKVIQGAKLMKRDTTIT